MVVYYSLGHLTDFYRGPSGYIMWRRKGDLYQLLHIFKGGIHFCHLSEDINLFLI